MRYLDYLRDVRDTCLHSDSWLLSGCKMLASVQVIRLLTSIRVWGLLRFEVTSSFK